MWPNLRRYPGIFLKVLRRIKENLTAITSNAAANFFYEASRRYVKWIGIDNNTKIRYTFHILGSK
jgi:hypothetical protein